MSLRGLQHLGSSHFLATLTPWAYYNAVTPGYFDLLGVSVVAGR